MSKQLMQSTNSEAGGLELSSDSPSAGNPNHCIQPILLSKAIDCLC
ncbi:hypothetical protein ACQCVE_14670 [Metabacillus sp. 113a]